MSVIRKFGAAIHRGLFWTYDRGTWQYDVMVALILAFIFFTPPTWFRDRPVAPLPTADIVLLVNDPGEKVYQIRASLMEFDSDGTVDRSAERVLETHTGKSVEVLRVEPALKDSRGQVITYAVWVHEQTVF